MDDVNPRYEAAGRPRSGRDPDRGGTMNLSLGGGGYRDPGSATDLARWQRKQSPSGRAPKAASAATRAGVRPRRDRRQLPRPPFLSSSPSLSPLNRPQSAMPMRGAVSSLRRPALRTSIRYSVSLPLPCRRQDPFSATSAATRPAGSTMRRAPILIVPRRTLDGHGLLAVSSPLL